MRYENGYRLIANIPVFATKDNRWMARYGKRIITVDVGKGEITIEEDEEKKVDLEYVRERDRIILYDGEIPLAVIPGFNRDKERFFFDNVLEDKRLLFTPDGGIEVEPVQIVDKAYKRRKFRLS